MKKLILILATLSLTSSYFSQLPDVSLSSLNLKDDVKEVKTTIYYFRTLQKSYIVSFNDKMIFEKENLTKQFSEYSSLLSNYEYEYKYNSGKLEKQISRTKSKVSNKIQSENFTNYIYNTGKLSEIKYMGIDPTTIKFDYNDKNLVTKESKVGLGGKKLYEKDFTHQGVNNYTFKTYYFSKGIKNSEPNIYVYEDNKLISSTYNSSAGSSVSTYSYNDNGDKIAYYYKGKLQTEYMYIYDNKNNWITRIEKTFNSYKNNYSYKYTFRKINYKKGITGSSEINWNLVKKYEIRDSYQIKPYDATASSYSNILKNPTKVKEMFVLKTQGSKFKVKTGEGNYLTTKVNAIKHTNGTDMILYHPNSNTTAIIRGFNEELYKRDYWHKAEILSSSDSLFWNVNEKGNWYITEKGKPYSKYEITTLKYSKESPVDVIVYINEVATYKMKNFKNATHNKLYPLLKL